MFRQLHDIIEGAWYRSSWLSILLLPLSWVFWVVASVRRRLYTSDILNRPESALPVIVVGNISVGGIGKTPVVAWLVKNLSEQGYKPGIVSRGYGGLHKGAPRLVKADDDPRLYGDEPVMLAANTGVPVCISRDRVAGVQALAEAGADIVISDDGLQHYRMRRSAELVVIDGSRGLGNGRLLPAGPLRESPARLARADAILINGRTGQLKGIEFELTGTSLKNLADGSSRELADLSAQRVWAVAGIGNPQRFFSHLEDAGLIVDPVPLEDHGYADMDALTSQADQPILMTEKDAVKYRAEPPANAWYLPVNAGFSPADAEKLLEICRARLS